MRRRAPLGGTGVAALAASPANSPTDAGGRSQEVAGLAEPGAALAAFRASPRVRPGSRHEPRALPVRAPDVWLR